MDSPDNEPKKDLLDDLNDEHTSGTDRTIDMIVMALVLTVVFVIMSARSVSSAIGDGIPSHNWKLAVRAVIFFILAYIVDRLMFLWRGDRCYHPNSSM